MANPKIKREHRISNSASEVWSDGGYHVGYVYKIKDGWIGRGRGPSRDVMVAKAREKPEDAAAELRKLLLTEGVFG